MGQLVVRASLSLSWSHRDRAAKEALLEVLELDGLEGIEVSWWEDSLLYLGEDWRRELLDRLAGCDYGMLLLSPHFFASRFVVGEELPRLLGPAVDKVLPVMLKRVPLDGSRVWHGVDTRQMFTGAGGRSFTETRGHTREQFALDLAGEIRRRILRDNP